MIESKHLSFSYGKHLVLEDINLTLQDTGFYGIMGPNGAGKSTLVKLLARILPADKKTIFYEHKDIHEYQGKELAKYISYVPQNTSIEYEFTVMDILKMGRYPHLGRFDNLDAHDVKCIEEAIAITDIENLVDKKVTEISGGELQRTLIARTLVQDTKIILLDEPISHLDIKYQKETIKLLQEIVREKEKLVIAVLHDVNVCSRYCDYVIVLENKKAILGKPEEVLTRERMEEVYHTEVMMVENDKDKIFYW